MVNTDGLDDGHVEDHTLYDVLVVMQMAAVAMAAAALAAGDLQLHLTQSAQQKTKLLPTQSATVQGMMAVCQAAMAWYKLMKKVTDQQTKTSSMQADMSLLLMC